MPKRTTKAAAISAANPDSSESPSLPDTLPKFVSAGVPTSVHPHFTGYVADVSKDVCDFCPSLFFAALKKVRASAEKIGGSSLQNDSVILSKDWLYTSNSDVFCGVFSPLPYLFEKAVTTSLSELEKLLGNKKHALGYFGVASDNSSIRFVFTRNGALSASADVSIAAADAHFASLQIPEKHFPMSNPGGFAEAVSLVESLITKDDIGTVLGNIHITPTFIEGGSQGQFARVALAIAPGLPDSLLVSTGVLRKIVKESVITELAISDSRIALIADDNSYFILPLVSGDYVDNEVVERLFAPDDVSCGVTFPSSPAINSFVSELAVGFSLGCSAVELRFEEFDGQFICKAKFNSTGVHHTAVLQGVSLDEGKALAFTMPESVFAALLKLGVSDMRVFSDTITSAKGNTKFVVSHSGLIS